MKTSLIQTVYALRHLKKQQLSAETVDAKLSSCPGCLASYDSGAESHPGKPGQLM